MERIVKIEKTKTMTNTWREKKTKTDKDKNVREQRITVKFSNRLQNQGGGPNALKYQNPKRGSGWMDGYPLDCFNYKIQILCLKNNPVGK